MLDHLRRLVGEAIWPARPQPAPDKEWAHRRVMSAREACAFELWLAVGLHAKDFGPMVAREGVDAIWGNLIHHTRVVAGTSEPTHLG